MIGNYGNVQQSRVAIAAPNVWTAVTIPAGAGEALLGLEDAATAWRFSVDNTVNATTEGMPVASGAKMEFPGECTNGTTVYVSVAAAPQTAILTYQRDPT